MAKRRQSVIVDVRTLPPPTRCLHDRQVRWSDTEFVCLDCKKAYAQHDGALVEIEQSI
jgi:hypothetical protein